MTFPPFGGRTADGRPYGSTVLEHPNIVGASIARPLRTDTRPVIMTTVYFALALCSAPLRIFTDGRPMAAPTGAIIKPLCHSENGKIPKTSAENNRADAKTTTAVFNADSSPAAAGRAGAKTTTAVFNADGFPAAAGIRQRKLRRISAVVSGIAVKPR